MTTPARVGHKLFSGWMLGVDLPASAVIGAGLVIQHGYGFVIHHGARLGSDCTIRQGVTLGIRGNGSESDGPPILGSRVSLGAGSQVLGPVTIGDGANIGAGAIVLTDVPPLHRAVGNPARILPPKT